MRRSNFTSFDFSWSSPKEPDGFRSICWSAHCSGAPTLWSFCPQHGYSSRRPQVHRSTLSTCYRSAIKFYLSLDHSAPSIVNWRLEVWSTDVQLTGALGYCLKHRFEMIWRFCDRWQVSFRWHYHMYPMRSSGTSDRGLHNTEPRGVPDRPDGGKQTAHPFSTFGYALSLQRMGSVGLWPKWTMFVGHYQNESVVTSSLGVFYLSCSCPISPFEKQNLYPHCKVTFEMPHQRQ